MSTIIPIKKTSAASWSRQQKRKAEPSISPRSYSMTNTSREGRVYPINCREGRDVPSYYAHFTCFMLHLTMNVHIRTCDHI